MLGLVWIILVKACAHCARMLIDLLSCPLVGCLPGLLSLQDESDELYPNLLDKTVNLVGSCSSLVAHLGFAQADAAASQVSSEGTSPAFSPDEALLLLAAILVDTVNLDMVAGRGTPLDSAMVQRLLALCSADRGQLYTEVQAAKSDLQGLTLDQLLRKDFKSAKAAKGTVGIASLPLSLAALGQRTKEGEEDFEQVVQAFCKARHLDLLVIMTVMHDPVFKREMALYTPPGVPSTLMTRTQAALHAADLQLKPIQGSGLPHNVNCFQQGTVRSSRKVVMPLLKDFLNKNV